MRVSEIIREAMYRQPIIIFHGTSSSFLKSIFVNGVQPNPEKRTWGEDPNISSHQASRESLPGSYWTSNVMTAMSSAGNAVRKFGGTRLYICAQINEQSAFADEDSVNTSISSAYGETVSHLIPHIVTDAGVVHLSSFILDPMKHNQARQMFATTLHQQLTKGGEHRPISGDFSQVPLDYEHLGKLFDDYMMRIVAHSDAGMRRTWLWNLQPQPYIPSPQEAEATYLADREWLTRRYRATAYRKNEKFAHTLRLNSAVGFRGHNRIVCILEEPEPPFDRDRKPLILRYGQIPDEFIQEWQQRVGEWRGVVTEVSRRAR